MGRREAERVGKKRERKERENEEGIEKLEKKEERGGRLRRRQKNKEKKREPKEQTLCLSTKTPLRGSAVKARPAGGQGWCTRAADSGALAGAKPASWGL